MNFLRKYSLWVTSFILLFVLTECAVIYLDHSQQRNVWKGVASLLRNEVSSANSYQISRALSDMEKEGWIKCVSLRESTNQTRVFYDTTTQSYCGFFANMTEGSLNSVGGSTWQLSFATPENYWLHFIRLVLPILIVFGEFIFFHFLNKKRKGQEAALLKIQLQRELLLDLTNQAKHDVASPLGALKAVIRKLEAPAEYIELLQNISDRIEGIFTQLRTNETTNILNCDQVCLEKVSIDLVINKIVREKEKEWALSQSCISVKSDQQVVIANEIEIGRVLSNLLNNSLEASSEQRSPEICIETSSTKKYCVVKISDNGIGIKPEILCRVGEKGFSIGKSSKSQTSGLGIYNAKKVLLSFGGDLSIESVVGFGTVVSLFLRTE